MKKIEAILNAIGWVMSSEIKNNECPVCGDYQGRSWIREVRYACPYCETTVVANERDFPNGKGTGINLLCSSCNRTLHMGPSLVYALDQRRSIFCFGVWDWIATFPFVAEECRQTSLISSCPSTGYSCVIGRSNLDFG